jgi:hypothetical protein
MTGWFTKPAQRINGKLNNSLGDPVVGGFITAAPSGATPNAGQSTRPGDRMILDAIDALALSDTTNVGTLYDGLYVYVRTNSTGGTPTRGKNAFFDTSVTEYFHQVTASEAGSQGVALRAGVFVSTLTAGYNWWIQAAGLTNVLFTTPFTGVPTDGCPVFAAADGAGRSDVLDGAPNVTFTQVGQMLQRYMGVAVGIPVVNAVSLVAQPLGGLFRF